MLYEQVRNKSTILSAAQKFCKFSFMRGQDTTIRSYKTLFYVIYNILCRNFTLNLHSYRSSTESETSYTLPVLDDTNMKVEQ